jgi:hypothetical protein
MSVPFVQAPEESVRCALEVEGEELLEDLIVS